MEGMNGLIGSVVVDGASCRDAYNDRPDRGARRVCAQRSARGDSWRVNGNASADAPAGSGRHKCHGLNKPAITPAAPLAAVPLMV